MTTTTTTTTTTTDHAGYLDSPRALGPAADESTYLRDHPLVEVYIDDAVLADNDQDLWTTIGRKTVRYWAYSAARPDTRHGMACFVCGGVYQPQENADRLATLDHVTAPWGGRDACGPAQTAWGSLRNPDVWLSVTLPRSVSAILTVDGRERRVSFVASAHNDSSAVDRWYVIVSDASPGSAVLLRGTSLSASGRHTAHGLRVSRERLSRLSDELPASVAAHAAALRRMCETFYDLDEAARLAVIIGNGGSDDVVDDEDAARAWRRGLAILAAAQLNPGTLANGGLISGLAIFDAAAAVSEGGRRREWYAQIAAVAAGNSLADTAFVVLSGQGDVVDIPATAAHVPADYAARLGAVDMLPDLDPMPEGYTVSDHVDVDALRRVWCTALAPDNVAADERIDRLMNERDPLVVLSLVAPYIPITAAPRPSTGEALGPLAAE
jgi:hypothetical protein